MVSLRLLICPWVVFVALILATINVTHIHHINSNMAVMLRKRYEEHPAIPIRGIVEKFTQPGQVACPKCRPCPLAATLLQGVPGKADHTSPRIAAVTPTPCPETPCPETPCPETPPLGKGMGFCCGRVCGDSLVCCPDPEDVPFWGSDNGEVRRYVERTTRRYIVVNEPRSGSSWLQEISITHPGVKVQFELDMRFAPEALSCTQCHRPSAEGSNLTISNSKNMHLLPPKLHPPLACGMTIIGHNNRFDEVQQVAEKYNAVLVILLRRNHFAIGLSSYRHFVEGHREKAAGSEFYSDVQWRKSMSDSSADYERLWRFPQKTGREAFMIFYEEMLTNPADVWQNMQVFLGLPPYDIPSLSDIHKTASSGNPFDYMNPAQLVRMRASPAFSRWREELTDPHFFKNSTSAWEAEFATICRHYRDSKSVLHWRRSRCINGVVKSQVGNALDGGGGVVDTPPQIATKAAVPVHTLVTTPHPDDDPHAPMAPLITHGALHIVTSHWKEELRWLTTQTAYSFSVCEKVSRQVSQRSHCSITKNLGAEGSTFTQFILRNWDRLPDWIAFVDANPRSWHQPFSKITKLRCLEKLLPSLDPIANGYIGMNLLTIDTSTNGHWSQSWFCPIWDAILKPHLNKACPEYISADGSAQFLVSRERIRRVPKALLEDIYAYTVGIKRWPGDENWRDNQGQSFSPGNPGRSGASFFLEWTWHIIFGEAADYQGPQCNNKSGVFIPDPTGNRDAVDCCTMEVDWCPGLKSPEPDETPNMKKPPVACKRRSV